MENPNCNLAPTSLMDEVWHFHILDTKRYAVDCKRLFDRFLHHRPSYGPFDSHDEEPNLSDSFDCMMDLYREKFGHDPINLQASCHTDSDGSACTGLSCCDGWIWLISQVSSDHTRPPYWWAWWNHSHLWKMQHRWFFSYCMYQSWPYHWFRGFIAYFGCLKIQNHTQ